MIYFALKGQNMDGRLIEVAHVLPFQGDFARVAGYPGRRFAATPLRSALGYKCVSPLGY